MHAHRHSRTHARIKHTWNNETQPISVSQSLAQLNYVVCSSYQVLTNLSEQHIKLVERDMLSEPLNCHEQRRYKSSGRNI